MAPCEPLLVWRDIPNGSVFKPRATGDTNAFNVRVFLKKAHGARTELLHDAIVAGTAQQVLASGDHFLIRAHLAIVHKPDTPITLDLGVFDPAGHVVQVPDGQGGMLDAQCSSTFDDPAQSPIEITIVALA